MKRSRSTSSSSDDSVQNKELKPVPIRNTLAWASTDSSDEEVLLEMVRRTRRLRHICPRPNHFEEWNDEEFIIRFRLSKDTFTQLLNKIQGELETITQRNHAVTPSAQLLIALRFYATGNMLISVGDFGGIHKSTACRIVRKVSIAIARLAATCIKMPENDEVTVTKKNFYMISRFPRVIGAIDCSHIRIQSPGGDNADVYRNRKGYFSLNIQATCSANLKFLDLVERWPGSVHDQTIFANSRINTRLMMGEFGDSVVLGDSGYSQKKYVMSPIPNPRTAGEQLYNQAQIRSRNPIERIFGVYKRRFPITSIGMRLSLSTVKTVIIATAVLHNICVDMKEQVPPVDPEVIVPDDIDVPVNPMEENGNETRRPFINYFSNLLN